MDGKHNIIYLGSKKILQKIVTNDFIFKSTTYYINYIAINLLGTNCDQMIIFRDGEWDFIWSDKCGIHEIYDNQYLDEHVKLNHFRNHYEVICLKFLYSCLLMRMIFILR